MQVSDISGSWTVPTTAGVPSHYFDTLTAAAQPLRRVTPDGGAYQNEASEDRSSPRPPELTSIHRARTGYLMVYRPTFSNRITNSPSGAQIMLVLIKSSVKWTLPMYFRYGTVSALRENRRRYSNVIPNPEYRRTEIL